MIWGNPPKLEPTALKQGKKVTPEQLAASGSEDGHQAALFCWAADNVSVYPQLEWMFAIPNGGSRHIAEAVKMIGTGTRSGVPDVFLPAVAIRLIGPCISRYHGCFIEMKVKKNKADPDQIRYINYLRSAGYYVGICYSWIEARDTLIAYLEGKL